MPTKREFSEKLLNFIEKAEDIGKRCSDEAVRHSHNTFHSVDLHDDYMVWKLSLTQYLRNDCKMAADAAIFGFENTVPYIKGGIEYGNKNSHESRALIKAISIELSEKLKQINELLQKGINIEPSQRKFYFDRTTGDVGFNEEDGPILCHFNVGKGRFKIIEILVSEKKKGDHFVSTFELSRDAGYKREPLCRTAIHAIRESVEASFTWIDGKEFIEDGQPKGYRMGMHINIIFKDTPQDTL